MIPNLRKKPQKKPGEGAFPLIRAKQLWAAFGPEGQDMTFQQFYAELCGVTDPEKMREDLDKIQMAKAQKRSQRLLIDRGLLKRA